MINEQLIILLMFISNFFMIWRILTYKESRFGLVLAMDIFVGLSEYVIISGFLFLADRFSVFAGMGIISIFNIAVLVFLSLNKKFISKKTEKDIGMTETLVLTLGLFLCFTKFGYFGMGQDEGVYQVKAIDLMNGTTERVKDFEEYHTMSKEDQEEYADNIKKMLGYDIYDANKPTLSEEEKPGDAAGIYHGIPTYPAMLALFGKMFGMKNMMQLHTYIYLGYVLILFYICKNLKMNKLSTVCCSLISCLSPIVIWVSKSSLTEMFLSLIIAAFIFCITSEDRTYSFLSFIPVCVFSFFHVTIYTMLPMFAVVLLYEFIVTGEKRFFAANTVSCLFFIAGICMMIVVSPTYTTNNIIQPFERFAGNLVNDNNCAAVLSAMALIFCAFGIILFKFGKIRLAIKKFTETNIFYYVVIAAVIGLTAICGLNIIRGEGDFPHLFKTNALVGVAYLTGIVIVPTVLIAMILRCKELMKNRIYAAVYMMFVYCILIRSALLSPVINHYYYYARYWAPYIAVAALLFGIAVSKKILKSILSVVSAGVVLPYDLAMFAAKDDTRMDWETPENISNYIDENDAVIIDNSLISTLVLPVKEMTNADIYFVDPEEWTSDRAERIKSEKGYENIYFISSSDYWSIDNKFKLLYSDKIFSSEDLQQYRIPYIPFPYAFESSEKPICLWEISEDTVNQFATDISGVVSVGFGTDEGGFAWCTQPDSSIFLNLSPDNYIIQINFPNYIPFGNLNRESFMVEVSVNGNSYDSIDLTKSNAIMLYVTPSDIVDSKVKIDFHSDMWSPADYGSADNRSLGFALGDILISKSDTISYSFENKNINAAGFNNAEGSFAWSSREETSVDIGRLFDNDYTMTIKFANNIPLNLFDGKIYNIEMTFNGKNAENITLDGSEESCVYECTIEKEWLESDNILEFSSELWSPSETGSTDTRELGFALESIEFTPAA